MPGLVMKGGSRLREVGEDGRAYFGGVDLALAFGSGEEVAGAEAGVDGTLNGGLDGICGCGFAEGVAQEHGDRKDLGDGVGDALAGDVGSGTAGGLIHAEVESVVTDLAEAGRGEHAERARDHGHFVGEDVAEEVFGDEDVEGVGPLDELHGGVVNIEVVHGDLGVVGGDFVRGFTPEDGSGEDVGFIDGGEAFVAAHGGFEGDVEDVFNLGFLVDHGVKGDGFAIAFFAALGIAEVDAAGEFADTEDIEAIRDEFVFDGGGVGEGGETGAGTEVGEEAEVFPQRKKGTPLGLDLGGEIFPFGTTDGAEEDGISLFTGFDGFLWEGGLVGGGIESGATDEMGGTGDLEIEFGSDCVEDFEGNVHDFWSDAVAWKDGDGVRHGFV